MQQLEWSVQGQSGKTSEINKLRQYIQKIEPQLIEYQEQTKNLVNELSQTKQNAEANHNRILGEKNNELEGLRVLNKGIQSLRNNTLI